MKRSFPETAFCRLEKFVSPYFSNGVVPRLKALRAVRKISSDLFHITGDVHFLALVLPRDRVLLTIHDCVMMRHPNRLIRSLLKLFWLDLPVRHCKNITTVSVATREDVIRLTGCKPSKIEVVPTVIDEAYGPAPRDFNARQPRILHIGLAANKNFERHVAALRGLPCELHIIGRLNDEHRALLGECAINFRNSVNLSQEEMASAYVESDLLLFASTFEGFGMPILEAQTVGRPVVTSRISSMPEVAGEGACLVDPFSIDDVRSGIETILTDVTYRNQLIEAGFANARRFKADNVALEYARIYERMYKDAF
ncbi:MAG: glycosyltransferase family 1 protein [Pseudomonadota bacterium]